ncbi:MAG TPA: DUF934 domain-containing protein, partial [Pseudomonadales bacterium]|nr:DUF934 domain-containing protein [Pseudomonadales bacterium]
DIAKASDIPAGKVIVSLTHWREFHTELVLRGSEKLGLLLQPDQSPRCVANDLDKVSVVAINFPVFSDGRGYSYARELREQLGFQGEIRAVGDVLIDQLFAMRRCGFDAFILRKAADIDHANSYLSTFTFPYQGAVDDPRPIWHR